MKTLRNITLLILLATGLAQAQNNITVQGEKKLNVDFKKYKTFAWMQPDKSGSQLVAYSYETVKSPRPSSDRTIVYSYYYTVPSGDDRVNSTLVSAVNEEMEGRGYHQDNVKPDLLIAYKVFDQSTKIKGYDEKATQVGEIEEVHQPADTLSYDVRPGTLMITLVDAKTGSMVWEGFASGVATTNDVIMDQPRVKQAVNLIFKKYEFRGDKYAVNN